MPGGMDPRHRPAGANCHVIRMRMNPSANRAGAPMGKRWDGKKVREGAGGCGEDQRLRSGGYFATQHRSTAGGLPTGNTVSGISTVMFGERWDQDAMSLGFEPQFAPHRSDGVGTRRHMDHVAANFSLIGNYGPGPGGYAPSSDITPPLTDRVPAYHTCQNCGRGGHWSFDCRWEKRTSPYEFEEAAGMMRPESEDAEAEARVCTSRAAGQECWGRAKWATEGDLPEVPAAGRVCKHCGRPGHYTHDCHQIGLRSAKAGAGVCPACRIKTSVLVRSGGGLSTGDFQGAGQRAGCHVQREEEPFGRHPSYLACQECRGADHFRCVCKTRAKKSSANVRRADEEAATADGGAIRPGWKEVPQRHGCQRCGRGGHWTWDCEMGKSAAAKAPVAR